MKVLPIETGNNSGREIMKLYRENIRQLCRRYSNDDGEGMELMQEAVHRKHATENPAGNAAYVKMFIQSGFSYTA